MFDVVDAFDDILVPCNVFEIFEEAKGLNAYTDEQRLAVKFSFKSWFGQI